MIGIERIGADSRRNTAVDVARLLMALFVVGGHGRLFSDVNTALFFYVYAGGFVRIVVPMFLLISGYYFALQVRRGIAPWLKKLIVLHLLWSAVFAPVWLLGDGFSVEKTGFYLLFGVAHLWYMPALIGGGIVLWFVRDWGNRRLLMLAFGLYGIGVLLQYVMNLNLDYATLAHRNAYVSLPRNFLFYGFPFLAIGHVIARPGGLVAMKRFLKPGVLLAVLALYAGEITFNFFTFELDDLFEVNFANILVAPILFAALLQVRLRWSANWLASLSGGIYFVHPLILLALIGSFGNQLSLMALVAMPLCILAGFVLVRMNKWIPIV